MNRRHFVRLVGGGTIAAAALPLAGCSADYPPQAVEAWAGPGDEPDTARWALAHAILAPSSHNLQPWLVDLRTPQSLTLFVDRERLLPQTDPWFRQIMVSQGAFIETLLLALAERGVVAQVALFPEGEPGARTLDDRPVARITWASGSPPRDPLFAQIRRRHTAKVGYDSTRAVAAATLQALGAAVAGEPAVRFGGTVQPEALPALRTLCFEAGRVETATPRTALESLRLTRIGPDEIARHRDGISLNRAFPRVMSAVGLFDRSVAPAPGSAGFDAMLKFYREQSDTAMGFAWLSTPVVAGATRRAEVAAGRAWMRLQLKATELGLQTQPMSQAPQEFAEMKPWHDELHRLTVGRPAGEEVVQMFARLGYAAAQPQTPRRPLPGFVRA